MTSVMKRHVENGVLSGKGNGSNGNGDQVSFAELLDEYTYDLPKRGEILKAQVLRVASDVIMMDVGAKRDAIVPTYEIEALEGMQLSDLSPGDELPVFVKRTPVGGEALEVSIRKGLEEQDWLRAEDVLKAEETVGLEVIGYNKGGLLVAFGRLRGFVPNSHVPELNFIRQREERQSWKQKEVGEQRDLKIIEVNRARQRLVLSIRAAEADLEKEELLSLSEGQKVNGRVEHIVKYGAFVRLNYITGLLHISRISWDKIDHPSDVLSPGDEIEVIIDNIDLEKEQIGLNRRALLPSPWETFADKHEVGDLIEGVVTSVMDFGAFIQLENGIEGLAHISEIDIAHGGDPNAVLQTGDWLLTRIISIEPKRQRLGLSLRRVSAQEQIEWIQQRNPAAEAAKAAEEALAEEETEAEAEAEMETAVAEAETAVDSVDSAETDAS